MKLNYLAIAACLASASACRSDKATPKITPQPKASAANPAKKALLASNARAKSETPFGITKIHTIVLTLAPENYKAMQPSNERGMGGPPGGPGGGPGNFGGPPQDDDENGGPPSPPDDNGNAGVNQDRGRGGPGGGGPGDGMPGMSENDYPVVKAKIECDGASYKDVGLRYKGNATYRSSMNSLKRSFKVDFDKYDKSQSFSGQRKITLNCNVMDGSQMRETLAYDIYRRANVPASRTAFAKVYLSIPGQYVRKYLGLYQMIEQVDERFLKDRFGTDKGLLCKPEAPSNSLPYLGEKWSSYKGAYDPKTKASDAAEKRFIEFVKMIQQSDQKTFEAQIKGYLDVDEFLRFIAATAVISDLDSFLAMGHNFYVFYDEKTERVSFIPWDLDLSFGGFPMGGTSEQQRNLSLIHPYAGDNKLIQRLLNVKEYKDQYLKIIRSIMADNFTKTRVFQEIAQIKPVIKPAIAAESANAILQFTVAMSASTAQTAAAPDRLNPTVSMRNQGGGQFQGGPPPGGGGQFQGGPPPGGGQFQGGPPPGGGQFQGGPPPGGGGQFQGGPPDGGGGMFGGFSLTDFISARFASIQRQLAGKASGYQPTSGMNGPGGPGMGGPGMDGQRDGNRGARVNLPANFNPGDLLASGFIRLAGASDGVTLAKFEGIATEWGGDQDADNDGSLSVQELSAGIDALMTGSSNESEGARSGATESVKPGGILAPQLWRALAGDSQTLSSKRFNESMAKLAKKWDANGDGSLSRRELSSGWSGLFKIQRGASGADNNSRKSAVPAPPDEGESGGE